MRVKINLALEFFSRTNTFSIYHYNYTIILHSITTAADKADNYCSYKIMITNDKSTRSKSYYYTSWWLLVLVLLLIMVVRQW